MHQHKHFSIFLILSLLFLFSLSLLITTAAAAATPSSHNSSSPSSPPSTACKSTLYPKLCRSILSAVPSSPSAHNLDNYGKFSIKQCLKRARKLSELIYRYVHRRRDSGHRSDTGAVEDCQQLFMLNVQFLEFLVEELWSADDESMTSDLVDRIRSRLSAVVTNQQTCYDGLVEAKSGILWPRGNGTVAALSAPAMFDVSRLYSVSLGLVTHALARNLKRHRKRRNVSGGSGDGLHPTTANLHRVPLEQFIKALQKRTSNCGTFSSKSCPKGGRILSEMEGNGIPVRDSVIVSKDGTGNFTTIGEAVAVSHNNTRPEDGYFVIYAEQGLYEEYIVIPSYKKNIVLLGDGINATIITGNHSVVDGWTTYNSSTFAVCGERFIAIDITFQNTAGPTKHQAVAVRNQADLSTFYRCSFEGYQDTLYIHSLRQFYRDCDIYGTVDFIFGNAAALFQNCNILARKPMPRQKNAVTAQGRTDPNQNTGISIHNCTVEAAPDLAAVDPSNATTLSYLGRPWKVYSRTVYMQSYIGDFVTPAGWLEWNGTVGLDTLYYGEFENYGPGADTKRRVQWPGFALMNASEALNFTVYNFTLGWSWLPDTDIPFSAGLLEY
ncbi:putative pectinesterase/pectinesterase inhibitor 25 [Morus notabilis]|uniref:Pectinesterase n=1 Tax=Morus notabilis TaxID=981085 RepID=W9QN05_9ROSA|nr:probable pectinesterase/pectinesterase inhibitor 25 [Morus notabilis]EXB44276.1 putative pectinesterase/pectinesterase inhibitor 25 [Morus notabilis]